MAHHSSDVDLRAIAEQVVRARGFNPQFPPEVQHQVSQIQRDPPATTVGASVRDLRALLWSSIDNDDSRDLDQIEVAERLSGDQIKVMVGIADVDAFVPRKSAIDTHAAREATTVYTGVRIFPMLPLPLSTGLSSLLEGSDKLCVVTEFVVDANGEIQSPSVYRAVVRNRAQLKYSEVGAWLAGTGTGGDKVAASAPLQQQLKLQHEAAECLKEQRHRHGALYLESTETRPLFSGDQIVGIANQEKNHASELIEELMIAANESIARLLSKVSSIRRVVKTPERWDRIVELAAQHGGNLPAQPDSKALNDFLMKRKAEDPDHFPDVSLTVVKLMGPGEYVLERPGDPDTGHFGLAVQDYTHSTAPNRRFADVVTQRLLKAVVLAGASTPYSDDDLTAIANNCTVKQDAARKAARDMQKRIAAVALKPSIGQTFDAIVTGATPRGTFVRTMQPHAEGMLVSGQKGVDVGDRLRVRLVSTDVQHGYIDFARE
jgi:VacB/RNase II family 3'-5' exoribonuclease